MVRCRIWIGCLRTRGGTKYNYGDSDPLGQNDGRGRGRWAKKRIVRGLADI